MSNILTAGFLTSFATRITNDRIRLAAGEGDNTSERREGVGFFLKVDEKRATPDFSAYAEIARAHGDDVGVTLFRGILAAALPVEYVDDFLEFYEMARKEDEKDRLIGELLRTLALGHHEVAMLRKLSLEDLQHPIIRDATGALQFKPDPLVRMLALKAGLIPGRPHPLWTDEEASLAREFFRRYGSRLEVFLQAVEDGL